MSRLASVTLVSLLLMGAAARAAESEIALPIKTATFGAFDFIHDDYTDVSTHNFHSRGLMTYGGHSNTFHVTSLHARYNLQLKDVQFFFTLRGMKDTHDPAVSYTYILDNVSVYDYGVHFRFFDHFFLSPRGASTYRENFHTYLLVTPYFHPTNPAEFDSPVQHIPIINTGPGIRVGYENDWLMIGYSQGDFRHVIPSGFAAKVWGRDWYVRAVALSEFADPWVFMPDLKKHRLQVSANKVFTVDEWQLGTIVEVTYHQDGEWWYRFEEAVTRWGWTFALRQMHLTKTDLLLEVSLTKRFENIVSLGAYYGTNGHTYFGAEVNF